VLPVTSKNEKETQLINLNFEIYTGPGLWSTIASKDT